MALTRLNNRSVSAVTALPSGIDIPAGVILSADLPSGSVLQVVQGQKLSTSGANSTTSTSYVITDLRVTITPRFANSKILVIADIAGNYVTTVQNSQGVGLGVNGVLYQRMDTHVNYTTGNFSNLRQHNSFHYLYTDVTSTSAIEFSMFHASQNGNTIASFDSHAGTSCSTITAIEIAG